MTRTILFYVSGHGFGHSTRVQAVIDEISPDIHVIVRTSAPEWLYRENVRRDFEFHTVECDVGLVQKDSLTIDEEATIRAWLDFEKGLPDLIERETSFIRANRVDLAIADIPAFPFEVTRRLGIPGFAVANFSWDWIYGYYAGRFPEFGPCVDRLRCSYSKCDLLFRLPFSGDLSAFPKHFETPLTALRSDKSREDVRRILGAPPDKSLVCVSFGGFDFGRFPWPAVERLKDDVVFTSAYPKAVPGISNFVSARDLGIRHHEVVLGADLVVTKPGYGIVAECVAAGTPILYTSRGDFPEYPVLVEGIEQTVGGEFVSNEDLMSPAIVGIVQKVLNGRVGRGKPVFASGAGFIVGHIKRAMGLGV